MQWNDLTREITALARGGGADLQISGVEYDSRRVTTGSVFVAMRGGTTDGNRYIDAAIGRAQPASLPTHRKPSTPSQQPIRRFPDCSSSTAAPPWRRPRLRS